MVATKAKDASSLCLTQVNMAPPNRRKMGLRFALAMPNVFGDRRKPDEKSNFCMLVAESFGPNIIEVMTSMRSVEFKGTAKDAVKKALEPK